MADDIDRVWELMKKISICMLASWDGHELHARPMGRTCDGKTSDLLSNRCPAPQGSGYRPVPEGLPRLR